MVVSADIYRPAAIKQLEILANQVNVAFYPSLPSQKPVDIVAEALHSAKIKFMDLLDVHNLKLLQFCLYLTSFPQYRCRMGPYKADVHTDYAYAYYAYVYAQ